MTRACLFLGEELCWSVDLLGSCCSDAMRREASHLRTRWFTVKKDLAYAKPYWSYEDIGVFFLALILLGTILRLFVRFDLLRRAEVTNPTGLLQFAVVASLNIALYLVLKFRHHQPVLQPLGWVWPRTAYILVALLGGISLASGVILYLRFRHQSTPPMTVMDLLFLGLLLGPILEESFFRGCLLPLVAQTTGNVPAVIVTAFMFALFHQPADFTHWVSFTATGTAYGWIRVASRSTAAAALTHAIYNLVVFFGTC